MKRPSAVNTLAASTGGKRTTSRLSINKIVAKVCSIANYKRVLFRALLGHSDLLAIFFHRV